MDSQTGFAIYHQRRQPIRPGKLVQDTIDQDLESQRFELLSRGETPAGDPVALVKVEAGLGTPVLALVVNDQVTNVWDANDQAEAVASYQKTVVLGTGGH